MKFYSLASVVSHYQLKKDLHGQRTSLIQLDPANSTGIKKMQAFLNNDKYGDKVVRMDSNFLPQEEQAHDQ
mgnify:CR=1 FL=1